MAYYVMEDITICPLPKTTLFDILQLNNDRFVRLVDNKKLRKLFTECEEDFSNKFPHYGFLLNLRVKEGAKRSKLMNMGARALAVLTQEKIEGDLYKNICSFLNESDLLNLEEATTHSRRTERLK